LENQEKLTINIALLIFGVYDSFRAFSVGSIVIFWTFSVIWSRNEGVLQSNLFLSFIAFIIQVFATNQIIEPSKIL
jgi:hypothetical protein